MDALFAWPLHQIARDVVRRQHATVNVKEEIRRLLPPEQFALLEAEEAKGLLTFEEIFEEVIDHRMTARDCAFGAFLIRSGQQAQLGN